MAEKMKKQTKKSSKINLFTLAMITSAFVISIRNFPTEVETGMHMIFFALVAAIGFFIPVALVSAELATGWPAQGGIYNWVKAALGDRLGFVSVWLQWSYIIVGVIAMLYFVGGSVAFIFAPQLASSRLFLLIVLLAVIWGATLLSLRGQGVSSMISTVCFLSGVLFPGLFIIILGIIYILQGKPLNLDMTFSAAKFFPDLKEFSTIVLSVAFMRTFSGIEASTSHAGEVENPKQNYPLAIFIVVLLGLLLNIFGSLSVAIVVPQKEISLLAGIMEAFDVFMKQFGMGWAVPYMGVLIAIGAIGGICTWVMGPVKGMHVTAKNGELPKFFQKTNKNGAPCNLLIIQAILVSLVGGVLLFMPNLNIAFWISCVVAMMIYFIMYSMMLISGIRLRYTNPKVKRAYKVPLGNFGIWFISILGLITMSFAFFVAFLPPAQISSGSDALYVTVVAVSIVTILAIPFIIYSLKRPSWSAKKIKK